MRRVAPLAALALAACHPAREAPGVVTPEQDRQLNEAADALDANALSANGASANSLDNGDAP